MNYEKIILFLKEHGHDVSMIPYNEKDAIRVNIKIDFLHVSLIHPCQTSLEAMPAFFLEDATSYPRLAHSYVIESCDLGVLCINVPDSVSINYECPDLVFLESLERHVKLLERMLKDPEWNEKEILREFKSGWMHLIKADEKKFICLSEQSSDDEIEIYSPTNHSIRGMSSCYLGKASKEEGYADFELLDLQLKGRSSHKGKGYILELSHLEPAPLKHEDIPDWFVRCLSGLDKDKFNNFRMKVTKWRSHEFWLVMNAITPSGRCWFGMKLKQKKKGVGKKVLPLSYGELLQWEISPFDVDMFNKERLMPRSGADKNLLNKRVLIVGCGSVGGDVADKLARGGVGNLTLIDPEILTLDNLYRHILPVQLINFSKTSALALQLRSSYPWLKVIDFVMGLKDIKSKKALEQFDLIIIAIGSPTLERQFQDWMVSNNVNTPVINTWLEGYGIGGHAVIELPSSKGCLKCAYLEPATLARGLSSNLNFIRENQDVTVNYAGCGNAFIPYNYLSASNTANISVDLALKYLMGRITQSSKVSWKGDAIDALEKGLILTDRYHHFKSSLEILSLSKPECDICNER